MTTLTGLIGYPVSHSLSPRIHAYWVAHHKLEAEYKLFTTPPARVRQVIMRLKHKGARGFNVTIPHKQAVMEFLDTLDDSAKKIGAVNTVTFTGGKAIGSNTDAYGFLTNLKEGLGVLTPYLENVIILGAGGATRAVLVALKESGATSITILNRSAEKAEALAHEFSTGILPWEARDEALSSASLLVNTTSLGMQDHPPLDLRLDALPVSAAVHDIVYAPLETALLKTARERGNKTVDGLGMLLYQAQKAFQIWHGITPEVTPELRAQVLA